MRSFHDVRQNKTIITDTRASSLSFTGLKNFTAVLTRHSGDN
jgi:hypothetical protein